MYEVLLCVSNELSFAGVLSIYGERSRCSGCTAIWTRSIGKYSTARWCYREGRPFHLHGG